MDWQQLMQAVGPYLGAMPSQAAPAQQASGGMPGQPQQAPKMQYGTGDILGSPALQGALEGYFGYLSGGRGESGWQRLGQGGLMGLQGYAQGRANQLAAPLRAAELKKTQAEAAKTGMETQQLQQQIAGRQAFAQAFRQTSTYKSMDPQQAELTAAALQAGIYKPEDIMRTPVQQQEFNLKLRDQARADTAQRETKRYHDAQIDRMKAMEKIQQSDVGLRQQEVGLRAQSVANEGAGLAERKTMDKWRRQMAAGTGPVTPKEEAALAKQAHDMAVKDAGPAPKPPTGLGGFIGRHTGGDAAAVQAYQQQLKQWQGNVAGFEARDEAKLMNNLTANRGARHAVATSGADEGAGGEAAGGGMPPLPAGAISYHVLPDGTLGYRDASGNFVPFGE